MALNVSAAPSTSSGSTTNPLTSTITVVHGTVYVGIAWEDAGSISAVTVGGVSASLVADSLAANPQNRVQWWKATGVPTGAGKVVSVTAGWATAGGFTFFAVDVPNGLSETANLLATASTTTTVSKTISVLDGDIVLAVDSMGDTPRTSTWTGVTEIGDLTGNSMTGTAGYAEIAADNASYAVTCVADSSTSRHAMSVLILRPTPTITDVSPAAPQPGDLVTFTLTGFSSAPTTGNCSYHGVALTIESGASSTSAQAYWPAAGAFAPAGAHVATNYGADYTLTLGNGTDSANATVQTTVPDLGVNDSWGQRDRTTYTTVYAHEPAGAADGDWYHMVSDTGTTNAESGVWSPDDAGTLTVKWFDVSAGQWGAVEVSTVVAIRIACLSHQRRAMA